MIFSFIKRIKMASIIGLTCFVGRGTLCASDDPNLGSRLWIRYFDPGCNGYSGCRDIVTYDKFSQLFPLKSSWIKLPGGIGNGDEMEKFCMQGLYGSERKLASLEQTLRHSSLFPFSVAIACDGKGGFTLGFRRTTGYPQRTTKRPKKIVVQVADRFFSNKFDWKLWKNLAEQLSSTQVNLKMSCRPYLFGRSWEPGTSSRYLMNFSFEE